MVTFGGEWARAIWFGKNTGMRQKRVINLGHITAGIFPPGTVYMSGRKYVATGCCLNHTEKKNKKKNWQKKC
jgi:hypothetical protein